MAGIFVDPTKNPLGIGKKSVRDLCSTYLWIPVVHQWNLGKELYEYQHKHFFERCPMPSVASLINYRDAGPETFHCPHETCVKVFYSKQNLDSHFKVQWDHDLRDEECICEATI